MRTGSASACRCPDGATHRGDSQAPQRCPPDINVVGAYDQWFRADEEWTAGLLGAMQTLGCTKQEIAFVRDIQFAGVARTSRFRSNLNSRWTILDIRLERLGKWSTLTPQDGRLRSNRAAHDLSFARK